MSYRVIFLFDIGEFYPQIEKAVQRFYQRVPLPCQPRRTLHEGVGFWFENELYENLHLALTKPDPGFWQFDSQLQNETYRVSQGLYRQVGAAVLNHRHPCLECRCISILTPTELRLSFDVGTPVVSHRLIQDHPHAGYLPRAKCGDRTPNRSTRIFS